MPVKRVLIVDDEPDILLLLRINVELAGFEPVLAADGDVALQRLREGAVDVVVLDIWMPVLDGWGVLEALRLQPSPPPVIVISGQGDAGDADRAIALGAAEYIFKPFQMDHLVSRIQALVGDGADASKEVVSGRPGEAPGR